MRREEGLALTGREFLVKRLTDESMWAGRHSKQGVSSSRMSQVPWSIRNQNTILHQYVPSGPNVKMLELGCFPGTFLKYFHQIFGHTVSGLEYVEESCKKCKSILKEVGVPATIIHGDLFNNEWNSDSTTWDVVFSAGLIEHFDDSSPAVEEHLKLVSPGGFCVITLPNHSGLNGKLMKIIDRPMWNLHNRMSASDVKDAFFRTHSSDQFELLCCCYAEHFGFWNCGVYERISSVGKSAFLVGRGVGAIAETALGWIPNSKFLSPNIILIAKKLG